MVSCLTAICVIYFIGYLVSIFFGCKRIMAEGIMVVQMAYSGLVDTPWLNPLHSAITSLSTAFNPINILYSDTYRPFDDPLLPNRLRGNSLYSSFLHNLNFGLLFLMLPLVLGLVFKLISLLKCIGEERKNSFQKWSKLALTEATLSGIIVIGCAFGCSSAL